MKVDRLLRINSLIQRELGDLIERDLAGYLPALVTVTGVKTTPDLQQADVFISVLGSVEKQEAALAVVVEHRRAFQAVIGRHVKMKFTPVLKFHLDHTLERADRILTIIEKLHLSDEPIAGTPGSADADDRPGEAPAEDDGGVGTGEPETH